MREIATRYGRNPGGYLWAFLEPMAFIAIMSVIMGAFSHIPPLGDSYVLFYATGYLGFSLFKTMEGYLTSSISANRSLMSYPIVAPIDAVMSRLILQGATSAVVSGIVLFGAMQTSRHAPTLNWEIIIETVILAWLLALGVSLANMVGFFFFPIYEKIYQIVSRPLFLLSGVFYVPSSMPHPFRDYLLMNPITHVVMMFREGFYGDHASIGLDKAYLVSVACISLAIGMIVFTKFDVSRAREK